MQQNEIRELWRVDYDNYGNYIGDCRNIHCDYCYAVLNHKEVQLDIPAIITCPDCVKKIKNGKELDMVREESTFEKELENLINRYSVENESNTPDYILVEYLRNCLDVFTSAVVARENWYGIKCVPGGGTQILK